MISLLFDTPSPSVRNRKGEAISRPTDSSFYQQLVHRHATDLYRYARRCTGESDAAEDIVREIMESG